MGVSSMSAAMPIVDADGHLDEEPEEIIDHLDPPLTSQRIVGRTHGLFPNWQGMQNRSRRILHGPGQLPYRLNPTPDKWLAFADRAGLEQAVLYPTDALTFGMCDDPDLAVYLARAYNSWAHERYMGFSSRLICAALIPLQNVPEAVKEVRRVHALGMPVVLPATQLPKPLGDPEYWPVYEEAERLGCFIGVHGAHLIRGSELMSGMRRAKVVFQHPFGQMVEMASLLFEGVYETFPKLKVGHLEAGASWVPYMMDRMDEKWAQQRAKLPLKKKPSDYLRECSIYFSAEPYEHGLPLVIDMLGADHLFCASDYPHEEDEDEFLSRMNHWRTDPAMSDDDRRKILRDSARAAYSLR